MTARPTLPPPITEQAAASDRLWDVFVWIGAGVLVLVVVLVVYVVLRFRRRDDALPPQRHYNIPMEVTYTVVPLLVVVGLFIGTAVTLRAMSADDPDPDVVVEVVASQWEWRFEYPGHDVVVEGAGGPGRPEPELVLPASSSVRFDLTSLDVVHSFWITAFRFKRDMIPGTPSSFSVDLGDTTGFFPNAGKCAEFCGLDHQRMAFAVRVLPAAEFDDWLDTNRGRTLGPTDHEPATGAAEAGP